MADVMKTGKTAADQALDATAANSRGTQDRLEGLLEVSRLAREARRRRGRDEDRAPRPTPSR